MKNKQALILLKSFLVFSLSWQWILASAESEKESLWEPMSDKDGIQVFRKDIEGSSLVAFRGIGTVDASIAKIASVLRDEEHIKDWTDSVAEIKMLDLKSPLENIEYNRTSVPWPFKDRDFVIHNLVEIDEKSKKITIQIQSTDHPAAPVNDCCVRGRLMHSSYVVEYIDPQKSRMDISIEADPMGNIPKWVVNLFQKGWPRNTLEGLRLQVRKDFVVEDPDYIGIFQPGWVSKFPVHK